MYSNISAKVIYITLTKVQYEIDSMNYSKLKYSQSDLYIIKNSFQCLEHDSASDMNFSFYYNSLW